MPADAGVIATTVTPPPRSRAVAAPAVRRIHPRDRDIVPPSASNHTDHRQASCSLKAIHGSRYAGFDEVSHWSQGRIAGHDATCPPFTTIRERPGVRGGAGPIRASERDRAATGVDHGVAAAPAWGEDPMAVSPESAPEPEKPASPKLKTPTSAATARALARWGWMRIRPALVASLPRHRAIERPSAIERTSERGGVHPVAYHPGGGYRGLRKSAGAAPPPDQATRDQITDDLGTTLLVEAGAGSGKTPRWSTASWPW